MAVPEDRRRLVERLSAVVDRRAGIIRSLEKLRLPEPFDDTVTGFAAPLGRPIDLHPDELQLMDADAMAGYGTAVDPELAQLRALAEAVERYCALLPPRMHDVLYTTADALGEEAIDLASLPQCSSAERARAKPANRLGIPDSNAVIPWIRGYSITQSTDLWVPLTVAYLGVPLPLSDHLAFPTSTGFAAGSGYPEAILSGLCEVIERDSLALWWLHQLPFPRFRSETWGDGTTIPVTSRLEAAGIDTVMFDLTTDLGVPVVGMVQHSASAFPHVVTMAACRQDPRAAALRVLEESAGLRIAITVARKTTGGFDALLAGDPQPAEVFGLYHADRSALNHFIGIVEAAPVSGALPASLHPSSSLVKIVERLRDLGMEVIVVDTTLDEVRELGMVVVRVIVPQLMPLSFCHAVRYLGHPRLYDLPAAMGFGARTEADVTNDPIPYA